MPQQKVAISIINKIVRNLKIADRNTDSARLLLAKELYEAHITINWKHTSYGSYWNMLNAELVLANTTCEHYRYAYKRLLRFGFTNQEIAKCLKELGWSRFTRAVIHQRSIINCTQFIKKYKGICLISIARGYTRKITDDRAYVFSLPVSVADKFDGILITHGMAIGPNGGRTNVMVAVMSLIDSL